MKFELNEKVWIKPLNREGIVISYNIVFHKDMPRSTTSYEVMYGSDYYERLCPSYNKILSKKPTFVYAQESDLEFYKNPVIVSIQDELSSKIKEMMDKALKELNNHTHHLDIPGYPTTPPVWNPHTCSELSDLNVEKFRQEWKKSIDSSPNSFRTPIIGLCEHKWQTYDSGWSKYDFCSKCDEKRNA